MHEVEVIKENTLTKEAEKVLRTPSELPEIWEGGGGPPPPTDDALAFTDFFEGAGALPWLGTALAGAGVGVGVGSYICNEVLELEGCWFYENNVETPAPVKGTWTFKGEGCTGAGGTSPWYQYRYIVGGGGDGCTTIYFNMGGNKNTCGFEPAVGGAFYGITKATETCGSGPEAEKYFYSRGALQKSYISGRTMYGKLSPGKPKYEGSGYCPAVGPGSLSCTSSPPKNWQERFTECLKHPTLCGATAEQGAKVGEHIAAKTPKGKAEGWKDPYSTYVKMPECVGELYSKCHEQLEVIKVSPFRESLDWKTALIEKGAGAVLKTKPKGGDEVEEGGYAYVETNPDSEGMPAVIPEPEPHETYEHYAARLNPSLHPTRLTVSDANEDVEAGPDTVLQVKPDPGTREDPAVKTELEVESNPHDAPPVGAFGDPSCEATFGSIDWSPLNQPLGDRFPFGVFAFFANWIGEWTGFSGSPSWTVTLVPKGVFGSKGIFLKIELKAFASLAETVRICFLLASFVGMVWFLGTAAAKIQGDTS